MENVQLNQPGTVPSTPYLHFFLENQDKNPEIRYN